MSLANHVDLVITADAVSVARAGFGIPAILSYTTLWPERVRFYSRPAEVAADGFATSSPEYLAVSAMAAQSPRPRSIAILRGELPPTMRYELDAIDIRNEHDYEVRARGEGVTTTLASYESVASAFRAEIHVGLVAALNAVVGKNFTAAFAALVVADDDVEAVDTGDDELTLTAHGLLTGDGPVQFTTTDTLPAGLSLATDYWVIRVDNDTIQVASSLANAIAGTLVDITDVGTGTHTLADTASTKRPDEPFTVTGDAVGDWFALELLDVTELSMTMDHADPGVATDLAAIQLVDNTWYWLHTLYNSEAYVDAVSTWVESAKKFYVAGSNDTRDLGTSTGTAGTLDVLKAAARTRTAGFYHHNIASFPDAAWEGNLAPREPGSWTGKFKTLAGIAATTLTATQRANLVARNANFYEEVAGINIVSEGTTAAGPAVIRGFVDNVVSLDWQEDDMAKGVFGSLAGAAKVPRTDAGMTVIEAEVRGSLLRGVTRTIVATDPAFTIEVPLIADMDDLLPRGVRIFFSFTLQGAIHSGEINGVVLL